MLTDAYGIRTLCSSSCKLIATGTAGHNASRPAPHCCRLVNGMANLMASSQKFHDDSCCNRFMPPPSSGRRMLLSRCLSRCSAPTLAFFSLCTNTERVSMKFRGGKPNHSCCHAELRKSDLEVTARHLNEVEAVSCATRASYQYSCMVWTAGRCLRRTHVRSMHSTSGVCVYAAWHQVVPICTE